MLTHACNPSTQETEAGEFSVQGESGLHHKFQASLGYLVRPYGKNHNKNQSEQTKTLNYKCTKEPIKLCPPHSNDISF
jgi:hypothetical protein